MGQKVNAQIIDETFSGLLEPSAIHEVGGEGIVDRPGQILLDAVNSFGREGFRQLVKDRETERAAAEALEKAPDRTHIVDLNLRSQKIGDSAEIKKTNE